MDPVDRLEGSGAGDRRLADALGWDAGPSSDDLDATGWILDARAAEEALAL